MQFYLLCVGVYAKILETLISNGKIPMEGSTIGRSRINPAWPFGAVIYWMIKQQDASADSAERNFKILVDYEVANGKGVACGVVVTFQGKDPHKFKTIEEFLSAETQEWVMACIRS